MIRPVASPGASGGTLADTELATAAHGQPESAPNPTIIGAVSSGNIAAERDSVKATLERGIAENPTATWVTEPRSTMIRDLLLQLGVQPVVLHLQDEWKIEGGGDYRRTMRDGDLLRMCDPLLVFHKATGSSPWRSLAEAKPFASAKRRIHENLHLIELGKPAKKKAK